MAYKPGARSTNVDTHTYIFPTTVKEQATLPFDYPAPFRSFNMTPYADLDVGIDPDVVNTSNQREFVEGLTSIPTLSIVMDVDHLFNESQGLYFGKGPLTHPASVELLYPSKFSDLEGFQVDCGVRAHSWWHPKEKNSFRLVFSKDFGPGMLRYPFFESAVHHAESAVKRVQYHRSSGRGGRKLVERQDARLAGTPFVSELAVYVRDQHARDSQLSLSGTAAHGIFVHLYLNGIYWGVYNAVERPDRRFLASYYGGDSNMLVLCDTNGGDDGGVRVVAHDVPQSSESESASSRSTSLELAHVSIELRQSGEQLSLFLDRPALEPYTSWR